MAEIRIEHSNGYTGILYGKSSMAIFDSSGNQILHTGFRTINTKEELYKKLESMPKFCEIIASEDERLWEEE